MKKKSAKKKFQVIFEPSGKRGEFSEGTTVIEASRELGAEIESLCGGIKSCGKCKVRVVKGDVSRFIDEESKFITESERAEGYRLGCATEILGEVKIFIPEESQAQKQVIRKNASEKPIEMKPAVIPSFIELDLPSLHDPLGDFDRLKKALSESYHLDSIEIDYPALLMLSQAFRQEEGKMTAVIWMERE